MKASLCLSRGWQWVGQTVATESGAVVERGMWPSQSVKQTRNRVRGGLLKGNNTCILVLLRKKGEPDKKALGE